MAMMIIRQIHILGYARRPTGIGSQNYSMKLKVLAFLSLFLIIFFNGFVKAELF